MFERAGEKIEREQLGNDHARARACIARKWATVLFREPARLTQLTEKSRLFWLTNGSLKNNNVLTMIGVKTILIKLLNEIILTMSHNFFKNALICYEKRILLNICI